LFHCADLLCKDGPVQDAVSGEACSYREQDTEEDRDCCASEDGDHYSDLVLDGGEGVGAGKYDSGHHAGQRDQADSGHGGDGRQHCASEGVPEVRENGLADCGSLGEGEEECSFTAAYGLVEAGETDDIGAEAIAEDHAAYGYDILCVHEAGGVQDDADEEQQRDCGSGNECAEHRGGKSHQAEIAMADDGYVGDGDHGDEPREIEPDVVEAEHNLEIEADEEELERHSDDRDEHFANEWDAIPEEDGQGNHQEDVGGGHSGIADWYGVGH